MEHYEREVAKCEGFDVGIDHGCVTLRGAFNFSGSGQGFGYFIDTDFLKRFMAVFRVENLRDVNGRYCWVTHSHSNIRAVEPMLPEDGTAFDVLAWAEELKRRAAGAPEVGEEGGKP